MGQIGRSLDRPCKHFISTLSGKASMYYESVGPFEKIRKQWLWHYRDLNITWNCRWCRLHSAVPSVQKAQVHLIFYWWPFPHQLIFSKTRWARSIGSSRRHWLSNRVSLSCGKTWSDLSYYTKFRFVCRASKGILTNRQEFHELWCWPCFWTMPDLATLWQFGELISEYPWNSLK
jgi:hypothetical protein